MQLYKGAAGFNCKRLFVIAVLLLVHISVLAQKPYSTSGKVTDKSGKAIPGANITLLNTAIATLTDSKGEFTIHLKSIGYYTIQVKAFNYATVLQIINGSEQNLKVVLPEENKQLGEVVVTAQKMEENVQKTAVSITVLSVKQVDDYRLQNTKELTAVIPNLYSSNPGDGRNVTSVRGISTTSYDPAVATYIDGVNQFGLDTYIAQLFDVERIEVLCGPQGTLYGRNAMGGVINIITRQPANTTTGFASVDFGNYDYQHYSLGLRTPLIKGKLFLGAAINYSGQNGFYYNLYNHHSFDDQHAFMGNYYLRYLAGNAWILTLNVKHVENRNAGPFPSASSPAEALAEPFMLTQNAVTHMVDNLFNTSISVNHSGSNFNFSSQTAYQSNRRTYQQPIDGDFSAADAISIVNDYGGKWNKVQVLTQELKFTSPGNTANCLTWAGGIYGFYQDNPVKQGTHFGNDAALAGSPVSNFTNINTNRGSTVGVAAYAQATYAISKKLDVTVGLRYDIEHQKQSVTGEFQSDGQSAMITRPDTESTATFHAISPKVGLSWQPTGNNLLFGTYSKGFRTGGISQLSSDPSQPPLYAYQPEYSHNFEIGSKNEFFNNRLRLNVSAFYTLINNAQEPTLILPDAITVTRNIGHLNSKGFELEMVAIPFTGLQFSHSFGYTHARYTGLVIPDNGVNASYNGNRPVFSPDFTALTAVQYKHQINKSTSAFAGMQWAYIGDQFFDLANTVEQKPYHLFNASAGVIIQKVTLSIWAKNIFNKKYIDYAYDFGAAHLGNPKVYGLSLLYKF